MIARGFRVGDLSIRVDGDSQAGAGEPFAPREPAALTLTVHTSAQPLVPSGRAVVEGDTWAAYRDGERLILVARNPLRTPPEVARIDLESGADRAGLLLAADVEVNPLIYPLDQLLTIHLLRARGGLLLHAACVANERFAAVVAGPSGAGKTTLARAAAALPGARILTDERVVVRPAAGGWVADGTPWVGEGNFARDETVPLAAIYLLEKSDRDRVEAISPARAMAQLVRCHFPATWVDAVEHEQLAALERLVREVPCYRLTTRLGGRAHKLVIDDGAGHGLSARTGRGAVIRRLLIDGLEARFTAHGSSMAPAIRSGDQVTVEPVGHARLRVGDIALVDRGGYLVLHRVRSLAPLHLQGDNLPGGDPPVHAAAVLGRVVAVTAGTAGRGPARVLRWMSRAIRTGFARPGRAQKST